MLTVCVCTFRRAHLTETLRSLGAQTREADRVVVIDNDDAPSARERAEAAAAEAGLTLSYVHAPARDLSLARNAALDAAPTGLLALLDDDETAPPGWLRGMTAALRPGLAAVIGPSRAVYPDDAPDWMREAEPHSQLPPKLRGRLRVGHTANCLIDRDHPVMASLRFDPRFGRTGGEDADYFARGFALGARYDYAEAEVLEPVTAERMAWNWLEARRRRAGQVYLMSLPWPRAALTTALAPAKAAVWQAKAATAGDEAARNTALLRRAFNLGVLDQARGASPEQHYG